MTRFRRLARRMAVHAAVRWLKWRLPARRHHAPGHASRLAVIGFVNSASGLGAAARGLVAALEPWHAESICIAPFALTPRLPAAAKALPLTVTVEGEFDVGVHVYNPDIFIGLVRRYGGRLLEQNRFNLAVVNWETERLPPGWSDVLSLYDGLAAPSSFTAAAIRRATGRPVHVIPNCVPVQPARVRGRADRRFEFLCLFDHHSDIERKNPLAAIRAFRGGCVDLPPGVTARLRVKCHANTPTDVVDRLLAEPGSEHVEILRATLSAEEMQRLWAETDCLVSLHRSEGFGLPVAEALARGIPVVATRQGGVLDFTGDEGCRFVDGKPAARGGRLDPRPADDGYPEWSGWIDPDADAAAAALRRVVTHYDEALARAAVGRRQLEERTSPGAVRQALLAALQDALPAPLL